MHAHMHIFLYTDLVIWGNEHESVPMLAESLVGTFRIYQPGTKGGWVYWTYKMF